MATSFTLEHSFPEIPLSLFEKYLNDPKLNEVLSEMPAFRARDLVEQQELSNGHTQWKFKVIAGGKVPPGISKVISPEMLTWWEISTFDPKNHVINWVIEPFKMKDKISGSGSWKLQKSGKGSNRVIEGNIEVKIPFIGKAVEMFLVSELKSNYEIEPDLQRQFYLSKKNEVV